MCQSLLGALPLCDLGPGTSPLWAPMLMCRNDRGNTCECLKGDVLCIETVKSDLNPYPMASEVLPNPQATQKCQDQHVTHTYQQDISNYCPVARQKELPEGQEHLWTEDGLDDYPCLRHPPLPRFLRNCAEGKLRFPQRKALWRLVGGRSLEWQAPGWIGRLPPRPQDEQQV